MFFSHEGKLNVCR